jgi:DNA-binding response OmpR family regulator
VLVVDDDPHMRGLLRDVLEPAGYRVEEAPDTDGLFQLLGRLRPVAVVLDDDLPGRAGLEALPMLRERWPDVPVVIITAFGGVQAREAAVQLGAAGYLDKPFPVAHLLAMLHALCPRPSPSSCAS